MKEVIVCTTFEVPGRKIVKALGLVRGNTVRSRNLGQDIGAGLKSLIGGEIHAYSDMSSQARDEALNRMINAAIDLGADAVVGVRFTTSTLMTGAVEMLAYGTAVKLK